MIRLTDDRYHEAWLLAGWLLAILIINPTGDFPLNDDWAYAQNAYELTQGRWFFSDWPAMTLIAHTAWGALWCKVFGFSFTVLRVSTLVLGIWGVWGFYRLLCWADVRPQAAFFGAGVLMFNPIWLVSAFSFMTEVPFLAVLIWATWLGLRAVESGRIGPLAGFVVLSLWACMIRQLGLLLPLAFVPLYLWHHRVSPGRLLLAVLPFGVCYLGVSAFEGWLRQTEQLPEAYTGLSHMLGSLHADLFFLRRTLQRSGAVAMTLGLFSFPLLLWRPGPLKGGRWRWVLFLLLGYLTVTGIMGWKTFPIGNVLYNGGLGAVVLEQSDIDDPQIFHLPKVPLFLLRLLVLVCTLWLAYQLWGTHWRKMGRRAQLAIAFSLVFGAVYWAFTCLNWLIFDRYVLMLLPYVLMALLLPHTSASEVAKASNFPQPGHIVALALLALFSIAGTRDYMAWNRARYAGLAQLEARGYRPEEIGGGFEYNGWHRSGPRGSLNWAQKAWWFKGDMEWMVSMHGLYGYDLGFAMPYTRWLPPCTDSIWFNRRKPAVLAGEMYCDMERITADSAHLLPASSIWQPGNGTCRATGHSTSGQWASRLHKGCAFGATTVIDSFYPYDRFLIQVWRYPAHSDAGIVLTADDGNLFWTIENSYSTRPDSAGWRLLTLEAIVPEKAAGQRGKFFLWNTAERDTAWFDDLKVQRWRSK